MLVKLIDKDGGGASGIELVLNSEFAFMRNAMDALRIYPRILAFALWLMPVFFAARSCFSKLPPLSNRDGVAGYFNLLLPGEIVVLKGSGKIADEAIVSHEHIHLLQHHDGEVHSRGVLLPQTLITDKALAVPQMQYFFEKREVEARLHECVLSCYRVWGRLPMTVNDFLSLLVASKSFGWLVASFFSENASLEVTQPRQYEVREPEFADQLETILLSLRTPELEFRFVTEVLPVMYANLLRYYGDSAASQQFLSQLVRPNLYDAIYGVSGSVTPQRIAVDEVSS